MDHQGFMEGKIVLVTGGVGTVGRALVEALLGLSPREVRVLDNNETELFLLAEAKRRDQRLTVFLGDVRDCSKLEAVMDGVQVVFHTAAFKHVVLCEHNPFEAVQTNVIGLQNVIQQAIRSGVVRLVFTSSDKAANPTSVMGSSKLMGERLVSAATMFHRDLNQAFASTRFDNVVGSRGSMVPVFARHSYEYPGAVPAEGKPYTSQEAACLSREEPTAFFRERGVPVPFTPSAEQPA